MQDLMIDWVEHHKGESTDGTWFRLDMDWMEDDPDHPKVFATEEELDTWLWNYIVRNPEGCLPCPL